MLYDCNNVVMVVTLGYSIRLKGAEFVQMNNLQSSITLTGIASRDIKEGIQHT